MIIRRALIGFCFLATFLGAPNLSLSQALSPVRSGILTIDQDTLFQSTRFGQRVAQELDTKSQALQVIKRQIEKDLGEEERQLTEKRKTLPPEEFRALADAFDEKVQTIRNAQDAKSVELNRILEQEQKQFLNLIVPVIGEIMADYNATIVMNRRDVFISANSIDITAEAIKRIDAAIGDGKTPPQDGDTPNK